MSYPGPASLERLFSSQSESVCEEAWSEFLAEYSGLIRHVARRLGGDADAEMDRYTFVLGALRANDFHRLRQFRAVGRGKFSTWLVAVTRRLCVDEYRRRYGRPQGLVSGRWQGSRRDLVELVSSELALEDIQDSRELPDESVQKREVFAALAAALEKLEPGERLLLRFRFDDGLSVPEIARITGRASPFPAYRELERILSRLRDELAHAGVEW